MIFPTVQRLYWTLLLTTICLIKVIERWEASAQTSPSQQFQALRNASGQKLCCLDAPSAIMKVRSTTECAMRCTQSSIGCTNFNVKTSDGVRSCELYPSPLAFLDDVEYGELQDCTNYEVWDK